MSVDALTYAFNLVAEKRKSVSDRRTKLLLELIPPTISVVVLLLLTFFLTKAAIVSLINGAPVNPDDEPNIHLMFIISTLNLLLDIVNIFCFARAKHALGYSIFEKSEDELAPVEQCDEAGENRRSDQDTTEKNKLISDIEVMESSICGETAPDTVHLHKDDDETNLNMCSAYTHVCADTLRSIAVILAALIAGNIKSIDPEEADATAAIVVSFIIVLSLIPLIHGIIHTWSELKAHKSDVEMTELEGEEVQTPESLQ